MVFSQESLPVRGAWIEMAAARRSSAVPGSLPVRGAWIEISQLWCRGLWLPSLPVRGAWIEIGGGRRAQDGRRVAPRAGSVD